jgi:hypothetical protein
MPEHPVEVLWEISEDDSFKKPVASPSISKPRISSPIIGIPTVSNAERPPASSAEPAPCPSPMTPRRSCALPSPPANTGNKASSALTRRGSGTSPILSSTSATISMSTQQRRAQPSQRSGPQSPKHPPRRWTAQVALRLTRILDRHLEHPRPTSDDGLGRS